MGRSILYSKKSRASTAQSPKFSIEKNCFLVSFNKYKKLLQNPLQNPTRCAIISHVLRSTENSRPVGQAVKTLASHAEIMGSIPVRVTNQRSIAIAVLFCFQKQLRQHSLSRASIRGKRHGGTLETFLRKKFPDLQKPLKTAHSMALLVPAARRNSINSRFSKRSPSSGGIKSSRSKATQTRNSLCTPAVGGIKSMHDFLRMQKGILEMKRARPSSSPASTSNDYTFPIPHFQSFARGAGESLFKGGHRISHPPSLPPTAWGTGVRWKLF